jgi:hypothetical protein
MKKVFKYIEPLWTGNDKKISLRSAAAMVLIGDFVINVHNSAGIVMAVLNLLRKDKNIDANLIASMSGNLAQIAMILGIEAALIAALLALKTYQPVPFNKTDTISLPGVDIAQSTTTLPS